MKRILSAALVIILILTLAACNKGDEWPTVGLGAKLPKPESGKIKISLDMDDTFSAYIKDSTKEDAVNYTNKCKDIGFTLEPESETYDYTAFNKEGYKLEIRVYSDEYYISIDAPIELGNLRWPSGDVGNLIPKPESNTGKTVWEHEDSFSIYVGDMTYEQYQAYVDECIDWGFTLESKRTDKRYSANNYDNYYLSLEYCGMNTISIQIRLDDKEDNKVTDSETETKAPADPSKEAAEPTEHITPNETKSEESGNSVSQDIIREDIKEAIDSYERFIDEYCDFLKTYDSTDYNQLIKYTELMAKEIEVSKKYEAIGDKELTDAESVYYSEVSLRCSKKLIEASAHKD